VQPLFIHLQWLQLKLDISNSPLPITFERWDGVDCVVVRCLRAFGWSDQVSEWWGLTPQSAAAAAARLFAAVDAAAAGRFWPSKFGSPGVLGGCRDNFSAFRWLRRHRRKAFPTAAPRGEGATTDWASVAFATLAAHFRGRFRR
jgi:hypothetical protein